MIRWVSGRSQQVHWRSCPAQRGVPFGERRSSLFFIWFSFNFLVHPSFFKAIPSSDERRKTYFVPHRVSMLKFPFNEIRNVKTCMRYRDETIFWNLLILIHFYFISKWKRKEKPTRATEPSCTIMFPPLNWKSVGRPSERLTELFSKFIDLSIWLRHRIFASYVRTAHSGLKRGTHKKNISTRNKIDAVFVSLKKKDHPNRSKRNPMRIYSRCNSFINRFLFEMEAKKRMKDENRLRFSVSITIYWYEKSVFFCSWIISFTLKVWFETWCRRFLFGFF